MSGRIVFGRTGTRYYIGEREVEKAEFDQRFPSKGIEAPMAANASIWNGFQSEALACDPSQVAEMNERNRVNGVGARYDKDGIAHIPDRADRRRLLKLEGYHDKAGGYSDG